MNWTVDTDIGGPKYCVMAESVLYLRLANINDIGKAHASLIAYKLRTVHVQLACKSPGVGAFGVRNDILHAQCVARLTMDVTLISRQQDNGDIIQMSQHTNDDVDSPGLLT